MAVLLLIGVTACGSSGSSSDSSSSTESGGGGGGTTPKIGFLAYGLDDFMNTWIQGMEEVAGGETTVLNANYNPQEQLTQCQDAIASGRYNVLAVSPVQGAAALPCISQAESSNIPVIAAVQGIGKDMNEVNPQVPGVVGSVVGNSTFNAEQLWQLAEKACGNTNPCEILVEIASLVDPATSSELKYFEHQAESSSNMEVVGYIANNYDPSVTQTKLPTQLGLHPGLDVIVAVQDESAAVDSTIVEERGLEGKIKIIGNGGTRQGAKLVEEGKWFGLLANYPKSAGEKTGEMVVSAVNGETISPAGVQFLEIKEPVQVTQENIGEFTAQYGPAPK